MPKIYFIYFACFLWTSFSDLNLIFVDPDRTLIQCHARENLCFFLWNELLLRIIIQIYFRNKKLLSSFIISSAILFLALNISVAMGCIFLWWIETELFFLNKSWNKDDTSLYFILNRHPYKGLILLVRPLLWNIQTKGQHPSWDVTNAFITVFLF